MSKPPFWHTAEREAYLRTAYGDLSIKRTEIHHQLNLMPGPRVPSTDSFVVYCSKRLGIHRPARGNGTKAQRAPAEDPKTYTPLSRITVDFLQLKRAAKVWNIEVTDWDDLPRVNDAADRAGHPGFKKLLPSMVGRKA